MKFKDVAHLYLGCATLIRGIDKVTKVIGVHVNGNIQVPPPSGSQDYYSAEELHPILRPLYYIKEDHLKEIFQMCYRCAYDGPPAGNVKFALVRDTGMSGLQVEERDDNMNLTFEFKLTVGSLTEFLCEGSRLAVPDREITFFLLKNYYDLFNLIEQNEAIDATTMLNPYEVTK